MRTKRADGTAMTAALNQAANADVRKPVARLTLRDTLLRFGQTPWTVTNHWSISGTSQISSEDIVPVQSLALSNGKIVRVWCSGSGTQHIWINIISAPGTQSQWSVWSDTGIVADANSMPSLVELSGSVYLWFAVGGLVKYTTSTIASAGAAWAGATSTGFSYGTGANPMRIAATYVPFPAEWRIFISVVIKKAIRVYCLYKQIPSSLATLERPWYQDGNRVQAITTTSYNSVSFFDAFVLNNRSFYIYSWAPTGECWIGEFANGTWGNPHQLLPNDFGHFHPYHVSVIEGKAWLSGRIERINKATVNDATLAPWSPAWDTYLYTDDGDNWTATARDSFLCSEQVRGKLLLPGSGFGTVYYAGPAKVYQAPATWLIDPVGDRSALQLVLGNANLANWHDTAAFAGQTVYNDIVSAQASFPAAGTAPSLSVEVANGDESWYHSPKLGLLKPDAELTLDLGYQTGTTLEEYVTVLQGSLDAFGQTNSLGSRTLQLSARDSLYKRLRDWTSLFWWTFQSQVKSFTNCDVMDNLVPLAGTWAAVSKNLLVNPSFENLLSGNWAKIGAGVGTVGRSQAVTAQDGNWSVEIVKTGGAATDAVGIQQTVALVSGQSYDLTMLVQPTVLVGGGQEITLRVIRSDTSALVGADVESNPLSDPGSGNDWITFTTTFTAPYTGNHAIQLFFSNITTGTLYVDTASLSNTDKQISNSDLDIDAVCYSTELTQVTDFDIRGRFFLEAHDANSIADSVGMGLVGCVVDKSNFILLSLSKNSSTYNISLWSKRSGVYRSLAAVYAFTWAPNTQYDLRLIHRQGHFWCYVKAASASTWVGPLFASGGYDHYVWDPSTQGPVINSADGFGNVGIRSYRHSKGFIAMGADELARVVPFKSDTVAGDFAALPTSGELLWNNSERVTYTRKTKSTLGTSIYHVPIGQLNWGGSGYRERINPPNDPILNFQHWSPARWWWRFDLFHPLNAAGTDLAATPPQVGVTDTMTGAQDTPHSGWTAADGGYCISFGPGQPEAPYAAWEILMARDMHANPENVDYVASSSGLRLSGTGGMPNNGGAGIDAVWIARYGSAANLASGYEGTMPAHDPNTTLGGGPGEKVARNSQGIVDIRLAPCLGNVTRGANGTVAQAHADGEQITRYTSDVVRVYQFEAHDLATDFSTESIIARSCALAGVLDVEFADAYTNASPGSMHTPGQYLLDTVGAQLLRPNFELTFDFVGGASESGIIIRYHLNPAAGGATPYSGRTLAVFQTIGGYWYADFSHSPDNGVSQITDESITLVHPTSLSVTDHCRVVVNGAWTTIYINGAYAACFHSTQDQDVGQALMVDTYNNSFGNISNLRVPELDEWRDALRLDVNQSVQDFFGLLFEDRPIFYVSRSGQALHFSNYLTRSRLTPNDDGVTAAAFRFRLLDDQLQISDNQRYSFTRLEAVDILEFIDATLAAQNGFVMNFLHMNKANNTQADVMARRALTLMKEGLSIVTDSFAANLRFEPEDAFDTTYTDPATGLLNQGRADPVNGAVDGSGNGPARALIVNDVMFSYDGQGLVMQVGARQRQP